MHLRQEFTRFSACTKYCLELYSPYSITFSRLLLFLKIVLYFAMKRKILYVSLFAVAMAFLETAVVIYLRELMYPEGFRFPLAPISPDLALTELLREAATLIMLVMIGVLAGKRLADGFAWFLYSFAVWDLFYYMFLKVMIGWPESLMTWDILFLLPTTWTGPVLAPVMVSVMMIFLAIIILHLSKQDSKLLIRPREWAGLIVGSLVLIIAFTADYSKFILEKYNFWEIFTLPDKDLLFDYAIQYIPLRFPWSIFFVGYGIILLSIFALYFRWKKNKLT